MNPSLLQMSKRTMLKNTLKSQMVVMVMMMMMMMMGELIHREEPPLIRHMYPIKKSAKRNKKKPNGQKFFPRKMGMPQIQLLKN